MKTKKQSLSIDDNQPRLSSIAAKLRLLRMKQSAFYLNANCRISDLAKIIDESVEALSLYFNYQNTTFDFYINKLRVDYAEELMENFPRLTLRLVCQMSGFGLSMLNFCRYFYCLKGQTLKQFCIDHEVCGYHHKIKADTFSILDETEGKVDFTDFVLN